MRSLGDEDPRQCALLLLLSNPSTASQDPGLVQSATFIRRIFHQDICPLKVRAPTAASLPPICKAPLVLHEISRGENANAWLISQSIPWHNRSAGTGRHLIVLEFQRNATHLGCASTSIPTQGPGRSTFQVWPSDQLVIRGRIQATLINLDTSNFVMVRRTYNGFLGIYAGRLDRAPWDRSCPKSATTFLGGESVST